MGLWQTSGVAEGLRAWTLEPEEVGSIHCAALRRLLYLSMLSCLKNGTQ